MLQLKHAQQKHSKHLYHSHQRDYLLHLKSLLPPHLLDSHHQQNPSTFTPNSNLSTLYFFNSKAIKNIQANPLIAEHKLTAQHKHSSIGHFLLHIVQIIAHQKFIDQNGPFQNITKQLNIDLKQLNKIDDSKHKLQFILKSIDKHIEDHKRKLTLNPKTIHPTQHQTQTHNQKPSSFNQTQKPSSFNLYMTTSPIKQNNFFQSNDYSQKVPSKYKSFIREQNKREADNFAWLQIKTKYPMLQKKLKSKLIQSINEEKNEKRIRELIQKKQKSKKLITNTSAISQTQPKGCLPRNNKNSSTCEVSCSNTGDSGVDIEDEKIELTNESLFMEQFEKAKIDYVWTESDQTMFIRNIKQLRKKCSNNSEFLKLCGRFKFISQKEFETLASEEISRMLNRNNKIYLSREFLLDKYFSTTQILTEHQMRFILKTSPMLSKCVDRTFIKTAIKNIKYENISHLELKIAQDIITRFEKLRNSVRASRKTYKQQINQSTKQRIAFFERNKQLHIAQQIARDQLKNHQVHLMRAINFNKKHPLESNAKSSPGLSKKKIKNTWTPLNKFHPPTGLFVKDCNEQCTDDIFNPYEKQYLSHVNDIREPPKQNHASKVEMIKFYSGGPDQSITTTFHVTQNDVTNICSIVKAFFFEKKILSALQSIEIVSMVTNHLISTKRQQTKSSELKTKKTLGTTPDEEFEMMAKKKLIENREKTKEAVYVNKLLVLAADNSFASLKALNPQFTSVQVNARDKKGNTALFYATKFGNEDFVEFLMKFGANPNIKCERDFTPLHYGFKSNNVNLILKLLTSTGHPPNLNALNSEYKTALAYSSREVLKKLNLEEGVASVDPNASMVFDNNSLLQKGEFDRIKEQSLEVAGEFGKRVDESRAMMNKHSVVTSLHNLKVD